MAIIIFIIVLSVLVFVHELGHFLAAKAFGIRVDEFGFGYPPRAKKLFRWRGTDVTLNWLPFGGFVKIFGEDLEEASLTAKDSFASKNRFKQAVVLVAGVFGNLVIAWLFFALGFMLGMPASTSLGLPVKDAHTTITEVLPKSPADLAGLKAGDELYVVSRGESQAEQGPEAISAFISSSAQPVLVTVKRGGEIFTKSILPAEGLVEGKRAIGFGLDMVGTVKLGFFRALGEGIRATYRLTLATAGALGGLIAGAFHGHADLSQVTGPVGLVGIVGEVSKLGFVYLLSFAALISINLSLVNLLPLPALDGGRLLFVIIESVTRKRIPAKVANVLNQTGFALLVLLMVFITARDIVNLF